MFLKSLELLGFKSFGRKTVFEFQPGITAIIGPNGGGKSNVCDAIRWALGEQSAKTLRGNKMSEVIYAGSQQLRPAAFAQVKLVLDNEDKKMPLDFSEVTIGRQLFRSGESNYFLNQNKTLLAEVRELLMDTGIGKDGYSVIGQGDIDDIIFQRTQSRRTLIEEAAGVTKFRHRKQSTLTKLDHTQANITRLRDIITEIENQLEPLAEQAAKTRRYQHLAAEIRTLEIDLLLFELNEYHAEFENLDSMRKGLQAKIEEIQEFLASVGARKTASHEKFQLCESALQRLEDQHRLVLQAIGQNAAEAASANEELQRHQARREAILEEQKSVEDRLQRGDQDIIAAKNRCQAEETADQEATAAIAEVEQNIARVRAELDAHLQEIAQDKESSFHVAVQMADKRNRITTSTQQIQILERQLTKGEADYAALTKQIEELTNERDRFAKELETLNQEITTSAVAVQNLRQTYTSLEQEISRNEEEQNGADDQIKILRARRNLLDELKNSAESGIFRGVRTAIELQEKGKLSGIYGMVGDLLTVPKGYETAFETALGGSIQDVVTRDAETAKMAIAHLKNLKAGRATFLPLDMISPPPRIDKINIPGCLGVALDLVEFDAKYYSIMSYLLGRIYIFSEIDPAVEFARGNRNFNRIVTIEGDIIRSSGAMTGGAESRKSIGILSRKREQEEMEERLKFLEKKAAQTTAKLKQCRQQRQQMQMELREEEDKLVRRRQSLEFFQKTLERAEHDLAARKNDFASVDDDRQEVTRERERLRNVMTEAQAELQQLENQNHELTSRLQKMSGKEEDILQRRQTLENTQQERRLELAKITERIKAARKEIEAAERRQREDIDHNQRALTEIARLDQALIRTRAVVEQFGNTKTGLEQQKIGVENELSKLKTEYSTFSKELEGLDQAYLSRARMEDASRTKLNELDIKIAEIKTHIQNKEGILTGEYHFDLTDRTTALHRYDSREDLLNRIYQRRGEQEALNPVNPLAIEDYEKTKERYDFLNGQVNDLVEAAVSLEQAIAEIEKISAERYLETFRHIDKAFLDIFQILFPGGEGRLSIANPEDPLNSAVNIVCRLPDKKLTTLELFSGGEKALISLALLFAILQVKPPAFCLLDEVEAALDEVNVRRFTRMLRAFADKTQFLVITHNKETMQAVDVIYGITLQKIGVSRPISIRLEDHEKIREFTTSGRPKQPRERLAATAS